MSNHCDHTAETTDNTDATDTDNTAETTDTDDTTDTTDNTSSHYIYIVECADGTLYTGYTTDVDRRVAEHNAGTGAKYTRGRTPVTLQYVESFASRSAAMSREYAIKQLSRSEKEQLREA